MARRRLEEAIQEGMRIAKGFTSISVDHTITLEPEVEGIFSLQYSFDGKFLMVGCGNGSIKMYDTATGRKFPDIRKSRYGGYHVMTLRFHPKNPNIVYAGTTEGQILSCDLSDFTAEHVDPSLLQGDQPERWKEVLREVKQGEKNHIYCMDFDYQYTCYCTAGADMSVRLYDAKTDQLIREYSGYDSSKDPTDLKCSGCSNRVYGLKFHPKFDDIFVTGGWENLIKIWDARSDDGVQRTIHGPHICGDGLDLKEYKILTASHVGTDALQIWNYSTDYGTNTKQKPQVVKFPSNGEGPFLYAAQFCDHDVVVAGGSGTNSAMAINSETNQVLGELKFDHPVQAIDTTGGGRLFAVGDAQRTVKMCSLH